MRIARLATPTGPRHAVALGERWHLIVSPFAAPLVYTGDSIPAGEAVLLASVDPRVVVGIGHNQPGHAAADAGLAQVGAHRRGHR